MNPLTGKEFFEVTGVVGNSNMPSGENFQISLAQIIALSGGGAVRKIYSGQYDSALPTDGAIQWLSGEAQNKLEYIGPGIMNGQVLSIIDGEGNASAHSVSLIGATAPYFITSPPSLLTSDSGQFLVTSDPSPLVTIGGNSTLVLTDNFFSITLKWDGFSNWIIMSYYNGSKTIAGPDFLLSDTGQILTDDNGNPLLAN